MMLFYFIEIEQNLLEYNAWEMSPFYSNCIRINWKKNTYRDRFQFIFGPLYPIEFETNGLERLVLLLYVFSDTLLLRSGIIRFLDVLDFRNINETTCTCSLNACWPLRSIVYFIFLGSNFIVLIYVCATVLFYFQKLIKLMRVCKLGKF